MKRAWLAFSPDPAQAQRLVWWLVVLVAAPLAIFAWWVFLQAPSRLEALDRVQGVQIWQEDLGDVEFTQSSLERLVRTPPTWTTAKWQPVELPAFVPLGASIDLPPDAPKKRVWIRIPVASGPPDVGRLALLGLRIQGGPWALWADGRLLQANLADWRIQWNIPLKATLPLDAQEVWLAVPYAQPQGFAIGSLFMGSVDDVESAWRERNLLHLELPRFMSAIALLLMFVSFQLAWSRPQEPMFALLGFNALIWSISCLQFAFDVTGNDVLSVWFGSAMDSSITWMVVLSMLFAFDFERIQVPRLRVSLMVYAAASTILTLPLWSWEKNALLAQQYANVLVFVLGLAVLGWHIVLKPRRERVVLFLALLTHTMLGIHTLENLTNQTNPDSFYSFPIGVITLYLAFSYVMGRRTVAALRASERHQDELRERLNEQEQHLAAQHERLQQLEVQRHLVTQHEAIMQDLHDRLGSNLTSALLQARTGTLGPQETVLLLQDLADELRHLGKSHAADRRSLNEVLAELRERVQNRLRHGGISLQWAVDPLLPPVSGQQTSQHLRALLSEAIANVIKHAKASHIRLTARREGDVVQITLTDNGQGFDTETAEVGRGLPGMRQRAQAMGAQIELRSEPGQGCRLELRWPLGADSVPSGC